MEEPIAMPCITFFSPDAPSQEDVASAIKELEKGIRKRKMYIPKEHRLGKGTIETRPAPDGVGVIVIISRPIYKK